MGQTLFICPPVKGLRVREGLYRIRTVLQISLDYVSSRNSEGQIRSIVRPKISGQSGFVFTPGKDSRGSTCPCIQSKWDATGQIGCVCPVEDGFPGVRLCVGLVQKKPQGQTGFLVSSGMGPFGFESVCVSSVKLRWHDWSPCVCPRT